MKEMSEGLREALDRWTHVIYPSRSDFERVLTTRKIKIYLGVDPTGPHIHLGHATNLLFLKALQRAGHKVIFLIGDFTARIGDPTDKLSPRQPLSVKEVKKNLKSFKAQASKIISFSGKNAAKVDFNARWLAKMNFAQLISLAQQVTVQQMIERDMFQERIKTGKPIGLHEFLYPLMQGYDSVVMDVDAEIGGDDQTFNMLMGRTLMRRLRNKEKFVITTPLLVNKKTGKKIMNKSEGGLVNLDDSPESMFGKIMALEDGVMFLIAELCSEMPMEEIRTLRKTTGASRDTKLKIAHTVVSTIHGQSSADSAERNWVKVFSKKDLTGAELPELELPKKITAVDLVLKSGAVKSKSEAWRLVVQGAVSVDGKTAKDPKQEVHFNGGETVKIGKKHFFRAVV